MLGEDLAQIGTTYLALTSAAASRLLLAAVVSVGSVVLVDRMPPRIAHIARIAAVVGALMVGGWLALARVSLFDDAYISFRYAQNLIDGHGLVWNQGERVEGYTNFLWTVLVAGIAWLTRFDVAPVGLWLSLAVFPCQLFVAYRLERALSGSGARGTLPLATVAIAVQDCFVTAGSTGLETGFACLLVASGVLVLIRSRSPRDWMLAGLLFILATLTRPDHAIFYASGALLLAGEQGLVLARQGRAALGEARGRVLAYAAPFLLYLAHLAFRLAYYGEWMPNTFYAKGVEQNYYGQGLRYAATFYLGSHFWALLLVLLPWLAWPSRTREAGRFKLFVALGLALYNYYVVKVGGDFMFGRFYVVLIPLVLIGVAQAARDLLNSAGRSAPAGYAIAALLGASLGGVSVIAPNRMVSGIADEHTFYPLTRLNPPVVDHGNFRVAQVLAGWRRAGLEPRIATSGIGMIGYYSGLEVIDLVGLTDASVAHQKLTRRGRPGHEHRASHEYIRQRNPHLVRQNYHGDAREALTRLSFSGSKAPRPWYIYHYDRTVMERIAKLSPDVRFKAFETFLRRHARRGIKKRSRQDLEKDTRFFHLYYFDHNDDPELLRVWTEAVAKAAAEPVSAP